MNDLFLLSIMSLKSVGIVSSSLAEYDYKSGLNNVDHSSVLAPFKGAQ